ncbi:MAG: hypothetical protein LBN34_09880 [Clostridiales Family XIII bacterium]|jgi:hypothetical protein|nr:hypothetical protein [Clostridiales Family XIII bacterium]
MGGRLLKEKVFRFLARAGFTGACRGTPSTGPRFAHACFAHYDELRTGFTGGNEGWIAGQARNDGIFDGYYTLRFFA